MRRLPQTAQVNVRVLCCVGSEDPGFRGPVSAHSRINGVCAARIPASGVLAECHSRIDGEHVVRVCIN